MWNWAATCFFDSITVTLLESWAASWAAEAADWAAEASDSAWLAEAPEWGWTTTDGTKAISLLRRFDAATVLNGHIHQVLEHTDGSIRFATARSTAFPQAAPGTAGAKPGPLKVAPDSLLGVLGYRTVQLDGPAAWRDRTLAQS